MSVFVDRLTARVRCVAPYQPHEAVDHRSDFSLFFSEIPLSFVSCVVFMINLGFSWFLLFSDLDCSRMDYIVHNPRLRVSSFVSIFLVHASATRVGG